MGGEPAWVVCLLACCVVVESGEGDCCRKAVKRVERKNGRWEGIVRALLGCMFLGVVAAGAGAGADGSTRTVGRCQARRIMSYTLFSVSFLSMFLLSPIAGSKSEASSLSKDSSAVHLTAGEVQKDGFLPFHRGGGYDNSFAEPTDSRILMQVSSTSSCALACDGLAFFALVLVRVVCVSAKRNRTINAKPG